MAEELRLREELLDNIRDCVKNNRHMKVIGPKIRLGSRFYQNTMETFPIKPLHGRKKLIKGKFYNLLEVVFFIQNRDLPHAEYVKKAKEKDIGCVLPQDRKALLDRTCSTKFKVKPASASKKAGVSSDSHHEDPPSGDDSKNSQEVSLKPQIRTYSRKRSHELHASSKRRSSSNEDQSSDADVAADTANELVFIKNENEFLERSLKSMTSFLKDHLGVSDNLLEAIQEAETNTIDLSNVAAQIKDNIVHAFVMSNNDKMHVGTPKYCYKAVKDSERGWEMTKQELSTVLAGSDEAKEVSDPEEHRSAYFAECLDKGSRLLKRALTGLMSQLKDYKPVTSGENFQKFSQKPIDDCLTDIVDCFREMFREFLVSKEMDTESVEKLVDTSRAELKKLFHSLAMTLQSVHDLPGTSQKQPVSVFHLPEPTFSLAINPAKLQFGVLLDMYHRIGLAELRSILVNSQGSSPTICNSNFLLRCSNGNTNNNYEHEDVLKLKHDTIAESSVEIPHGEDFQDTRSSTAIEETSSDRDRLKSQLLEGLLVHRNGGSKSTINSESTYRTRRSLVLTHEYSMFKASLGNTLVSSFKKQIQEKIYASQGSKFLIYRR